jgi:alpha-glucoside transport system substrate-binding protein
MQQASTGLRRLTVLGAVVVLAAAACGTSTASGGGKVTVIGTWGGAEQESFLAMVKPWEDKTGNTVQYTGTRDINAVLTTGVASGILPDLAGLPGPGQMVDWGKSGALKPLDNVLDTATYKAETSPAFVDLGTVDGKIVGVFIKSALKGLIWYNPANYTGGAPASWDAVMNTPTGAADSLWCVGLESGAASGWPGTDWIEDFVLRQSGPDVYDAWVNGTQKWASPEIKSAFQEFGKVLDKTYGGANTVVSTNFGDGGNPLFTNPPGCLFHHQASFITDFFKNQGGAQDGQFDFFPMPDLNPTYAGAFTGAGDLFGMFNDTPEARSLLKYLVTAEAQQIWVSRGGALSGNTKVTSYPDDVSKRSAEILGTAKIFRFDGGDLMPTALQSAFFKAMVDFAQDQSKLDSILAGLDEASTAARGG